MIKKCKLQKLFDCFDAKLKSLKLWILADWRQKIRLFETKNLDCFTKNISCLFGIVLNLASVTAKAN